MVKILYLGVAGLIGVLLRYWLSGWVDQRFGATFPLGTMLVNLAGCFAAGFLFHYLTEKLCWTPWFASPFWLACWEDLPLFPPTRFKRSRCFVTVKFFSCCSV